MFVALAMNNRLDRSPACSNIKELLNRDNHNKQTHAKHSCGWGTSDSKSNSKSNSNSNINRKVLVQIKLFAIVKSGPPIELIGGPLEVSAKQHEYCHLSVWATTTRNNNRMYYLTCNEKDGDGCIGVGPDDGAAEEIEDDEGLAVVNGALLEKVRKGSVLRLAFGVRIIADTTM